MSDVEATELVVPEAELELERRQGMSVIAPEELPLLPGEVKPHPSPFAYVIIAVVLCVITALEVGLSYMEGDLPNALLVAMLLVMAAIKFFLVAAWFMHLRTDKPVFRRVFILGGAAAIVLYTIAMSTLHIFSQ